MKLVYFFISVICCLPFKMNAQYTMQNSPIVLDSNGQAQQKFWVCLHRFRGKLNATKSYAYYSKGNLNESQGSYTGYLLNGRFEETSTEGLLVKQGKYKCGLKHGHWKYWDPNGQLVRMEKWTKGNLKKPDISLEKGNRKLLKRTKPFFKRKKKVDDKKEKPSSTESSKS